MLATDSKLIKMSMRQNKIYKNLLFNFFFYYINSIFLRIEKFISGTAKVTKHIISSIIQQNIFYLKRRKSVITIFKVKVVCFLTCWDQVLGTYIRNTRACTHTHTHRHGGGRSVQSHHQGQQLYFSGGIRDIVD